MSIIYKEKGCFDEMLSKKYDPLGALKKLVSFTSVEPVTNEVLTPRWPAPSTLKTAALPDKDLRSNDLATNAVTLTNTDRCFDETVAKPRDEGSDFTFEEPICIDKVKKATTVHPHRNGNYNTQPHKKKRQKEKTLRREFAPACERASAFNFHLK
ncbi:hypothetical protein E4U59_003795 [Claviceps monticola]|nr:hypothetical protein E4U59_003795 [Claviceps monticola]